MFVNIIALRSFYGSAPGRHVQRSIAAALQPYAAAGQYDCVMGFGYATPYLEAFAAGVDRCFAFMPAQQGAVIWPGPDAVATALVSAEALPLPEASVDCILMVHGLEQSENADETLRELWRVLTPEGRLVVVAANRHGLWARADFTPFGHGEPYSRGQLQHLLQETGFSIGRLCEAVHFLPRANGRFGALSSIYEKTASRFFPYFGGVLIAEAQKRIYRRLPVARRKAKRVLVPALQPQPQPNVRRMSHEVMGNKKKPKIIFV